MAFSISQGRSGGTSLGARSSLAVRSHPRHDITILPGGSGNRSGSGRGMPMRRFMPTHGLFRPKGFRSAAGGPILTIQHLQDTRGRVPFYESPSRCKYSLGKVAPILLFERRLVGPAQMGAASDDDCPSCDERIPCPRELRARLRQLKSKPNPKSRLRGARSLYLIKQPAHPTIRDSRNRDAGWLSARPQTRGQFIPVLIPTAQTVGRRHRNGSPILVGCMDQTRIRRAQSAG